LFASTNVRLELDYNYSYSPPILLAENTDNPETDEDENWDEWKRDNYEDTYYRKIPKGLDLVDSYIGAGLAYLSSLAFAILFFFNDAHPMELGLILHAVSPTVGSVLFLHIRDKNITCENTIPAAIMASLIGGCVGLIIDKKTNPTEPSYDQPYEVFALGSLILGPLGAVIGYRQTAPLQPEKSVSVHPPSFEFTNTTYPDGSVELSTKLVLVDVRF